MIDPAGMAKIGAIAEVAPHSSPDPDEAPEWDAEAFARAELREGDRLPPPGRQS